MKVHERLYEAAKDVWAGYLVHPFITELGAGTLPAAKFRYYMIQDYLYLFDYLKLFALGIVKAGSDEALMRSFAGSIFAILDEELAIHRGYMADIGVTREEAEGTPMALDNASYTAYMLAQGEMGGAPEIMAAILACAWSYGVIAKSVIGSFPDSVNHPVFGRWVRGYGSDEYKKGNERLFALTDRVCEGLPESRIQKLCEIFRNCSRYEAMFWDMAYEMKN
ncbi:MAG TPA: thiaminase II [Candidatus Acidoferrum sp.]|nr:thiaminase II [Candidatus Acidoferrum sp.]